jgi:hypothetical protein
MSASGAAALGNQEGESSPSLESYCEIFHETNQNDGYSGPGGEMPSSKQATGNDFDFSRVERAHRDSDFYRSAELDDSEP